MISEGLMREEKKYRSPGINSGKNPKLTLTDGSKLITEALVKAGADVFVAYPITPSNLFYAYANQCFPSFYPAPDEISTMQWMSGLSAAGKLPVSATAFPGLALMTESLNMACMMELPMVLILTQRLGPSTGSATTGAQGDLTFVSGIISGGYPLPVFCPSNFEDCWTLACKSLETAVKLRTPVIFLTSKEMVMTNRSFDLSRLEAIRSIKKKSFKPDGPYQSYSAGDDLVPPFIFLGNPDFQVRMNSSTHDNEGFIRNNKESFENTARLKRKIEEGISEMTFYDLDEDKKAETLIVSYGISSYSAREALYELRNQGKKVSLLILKTLLPVAPVVLEILDRYRKLLFVEENISGQLKELIFGRRNIPYLTKVNKIGSLITPGEVLEGLI